MTVLQTLREFHAQGIGAVKVAALPALTGMSQIKIDAEVVAITKASLATNSGGYLRIAAPPIDCPDVDDETYRKQCIVCGEYKLGEMFYPSKDTKDGLRGQCKPCLLAAQQEARRGRPRSDSKRRVCPCCRKTKPAHYYAAEPPEGRHKRWPCLECESRKRRERAVLEAGKEALCGAWP